MPSSLGFTRFEEFAPGKVYANDQFPGGYQNIEERTGIRTRNIAGSNDTIESIGIEAAHKLFQALNIRSPDCGGLVLSSSSMPGADDNRMTDVARRIASALGVRGPVAGVNFACSGFPKAVQEAVQMTTKTDRHIVIITSEILSRIVDWNNEATAVLFGDRAAATTVKENGDHPILDARAWEVDDPAQLIRVQKSDHAMDAFGRTAQRMCMTMNGKALFRLAPREMVSLCEDSMKTTSLQPADVSMLVPHQANGRFMLTIKHIIDKKYLSEFEHLWILDKIADMGNVGSSSIPSALSHVQDDYFQPGTAIVCPTIGAGAQYDSGKLTKGVVTFRVSGEKL